MSFEATFNLDSKDLEIIRLRKWLEYIEGNFSDHRDCAQKALAGEPDPFHYDPPSTSGQRQECSTCHNTRLTWFMRPDNRPTSVPCTACSVNPPRR